MLSAVRHLRLSRPCGVSGAKALGACSLDQRWYTRGVATSEGTAAFAKRWQQGHSEDFMQLPNARGVLVSRIGWGADDIGRPVNERYRSLWRAVRDRGCNVVHVDLDSVYERVRRYEDFGEDAGVSGPLRLEMADPEDGCSSDDGELDARMKARGLGNDTVADPAQLRSRTGRQADELADAVVWEAHALSRLFESEISRSEVCVCVCVCVCACVCGCW